MGAVLQHLATGQQTWRHDEVPLLHDRIWYVTKDGTVKRSSQLKGLRPPVCEPVARPYEACSLVGILALGGAVQMKTVFRQDTLIGAERGLERHGGTLFYSLRDVEQLLRSERALVVARRTMTQTALLACAGESIALLFECEVPSMDVRLTIGSICQAGPLIPCPDDAQ